MYIYALFVNLGWKEPNKPLKFQDMKTSELIKALQEELAAKGDKDIVIAANRHSYRNVKLVTKENTTTLALFDKIQD